MDYKTIKRIQPNIWALTLVAVLFLVGLSGSKNILVKEELPEKNPSIVNIFAGVSLEGEAAVILDVNTGKIIFEKNSEAQLPLASLTKIMTTLEASNLIPNETTVIIDEKSLNTEGDSGFFPEEKWKFKDLRDFTLITSSNDGAGAISQVASAFLFDSNIETSFLDVMNKKAKSLGLKQTYFMNESGLDLNENVSGAYGSARDVAKLMAYVIKKDPELLEATGYNQMTFESLSGMKHEAENTNNGIGGVAGLLASKTGFTDLAGGNLVIAFDAGIGRPIVIVVLGSSIDGRFNDVLKLYKATLRQLVLNG